MNKESLPSERAEVEEELKAVRLYIEGSDELNAFAIKTGVHAAKEYFVWAGLSPTKAKAAYDAHERGMEYDGELYAAWVTANSIAVQNAYACMKRNVGEGWLEIAPQVAERSKAISLAMKQSRALINKTEELEAKVDFYAGKWVSAAHEAAEMRIKRNGWRITALALIAMEAVAILNTYFFN